MLPIKNILYPTDFSDRSEKAFQLACALARDYEARLIILHVAEPPAFITHGEMARALDHMDGYKEELKDKLRELQAPDCTVVVARSLQQGDPAAEILRSAEETNADLIVMGTHGRTGLRRLLMGSVAEQVVRRAGCPVLTVKTPFAEPLPELKQVTSCRSAELTAANESS